MVKFILAILLMSPGPIDQWPTEEAGVCTFQIQDRYLWECDYSGAFDCVTCAGTIVDGKCSFSILCKGSDCYCYDANPPPPDMVPDTST